MSYADGRKPKDDEIKLVSIEASDGLILLSYAGLEATGRGARVSDWVRLALRSVQGTVEEILAEIGRLAQQEFQKHLVKLPFKLAMHTFLASAAVAGEVRLYTIGLTLSSDGVAVDGSYSRQFVSHGRPPRIALSGSGADLLFKNTSWIRPLLRLVSAHEKGKVTAQAVSDRIAAILFGVHLREQSVGPNGVVIWRYTDVGGGAQQFYRSTVRHDGWAPIPALLGGMDINQLAAVSMKHMMAHLDAARQGLPVSFDAEQINADLSALDWSRKPKLL